MNAILSSQSLLDVSRAITELAMNWFLQSSLLIVAGLMIGHLLRTRGSAVQSAVYRTTLVAAILCPLATWLLSLAGAPGWSVAMPVAYEVVATGGSPVAEAVGELPDTTIDSSSNLSPLFDLSAVSDPSFAPTGVSPVATPNLEQSPIAQVEAQLSPAAMSAELPTVEPPVATESEFRVRSFGIVAIAFSAIWVMVTAVMLIPLALASYGMAKLRRTACPSTTATLQLCDELATRMNVHAPDVLHSPYLPGPCLTGLRRPAVLLPDDDLHLPVRDVLIHELAHLARHDCHWNLLRRAATALFFFQPLLWKLSRRIEASAEEVCDDYVVSYGGDRRDYAHRLVDLAELSTAPMAPACVGIVSLRSMLTRRVARIMDSSRSLSTSVGHALLALVLIGGLFATMLAGLVGIGPREGVAETDAAVEGEMLYDLVVEEQEDEDLITVRGRVIDPNEIPFAGATVSAGCSWWEDGKVVCLPIVSTDTDASGRFTLTYRKSQYDLDARGAAVTIVAVADGFGPAWVATRDLAPQEEPMLRLVRDDIPIRGRVVDLEGQPIAGAILKIGGLATGKNNDLTPWLDAIRRGELLWQAANTYLASLLPYELTGLPTKVETDADGRFSITGIGRERRLQFVLEHTSFALTEGMVITRRTDPMIANTGVPDPEWGGKVTLYGAEFEIAVPPTQPIVGTVRDSETGEPLVGVEVHSYRMSERGLSAGKDIRVTSDEQGRYRLVGMPKGTGRQIIAVPNDEQPYLMREFDVPDKLGLEAVELDLELHRGVWITGRVTDKQTGQPVGDPAQVRLYYIPFRDNPFAQLLPEYGSGSNADGYQDRYEAAKDGSYRMVGLPGRAIVGLTCWNKPYLSGMGSDSIEGISEDGKFPTYSAPLQAGRKWPHAMKEVNIPEGVRKITMDFELDPGRSLRITSIDTDERQLAGVTVEGMEGLGGSRRTTDTATFDALAFGPDERRTMLLHHKGRNLGQVVRAHTDDSPRVVTLQPCATIRGRVVDDKDHPVVGARIRLYVLPGGDFEPELDAVATDEEGRFEHASVLPGSEYNVLLESSQVGFKEVAEDIAVLPGETIDLGTIDVTSEERLKPVRMKAGTTTASEDQDTMTVSGQVIDNDGKLVANARIVATQTRWLDSRFVQNEQRQVTEARSAADGTFAIEVPRIEKPDYGVNRLSYFEWKPPIISATAPGHAPDWIGGGEWRPDHPLMKDVTLRLHKQTVPIRGRLVNLEGQPQADLNVRVNVLATTKPGKVDEWLATVEQMRKEGKLPRASEGGTLSLFSSAMVMAAENVPEKRQNAYFPMTTIVFPDHPNYPPAVRTDSQGRFQIEGLPPDCLAVLEISGPGVATQSVSAVTRKIDRIDVPSTGIIVGNDSNGYYGAEFDYPVAPGSTIVGTVKDAESGQPIEGVQVRSTVIVNRMASNRTKWISVTDADGEFRIEGLPAGSKKQIDIFPTPDQPYLKAESVGVSEASGDEPNKVDVKLRRGVLVRGKVTDEETGEPVDATIHYHPLLTNENARNFGYDPQLFRHDEGERYRTAEDGSFQATVIPGRGILGVQAVERGGYCFGLGSEKIATQDDGRFATYDFAFPKLFNRVVEIDTPADAAEIKQDFTISRGVNVKLRVQDAEGKPLVGVQASGQTPFGFPGNDASDGDLLEFKAFRPGEIRRVLLMHKERKLGRIEMLTAPQSVDEATVRTVTLAPCATVSGHVVDGEGEPLAGLQFAAHALPIRDLDVVTPQQVSTDADGKFQFDYLPGGATYRIGGSDQKLGFVEITKELEIEPGEVIDLGTIYATSNERPEPVRTRRADYVINSDKLKQSSYNSDADGNTTVIEYAGKVITPTGEPAANAKLFLVYHVLIPDEPLAPTWKPIGKTDESGIFRIVLSAKDLPGNEREWGAASLVATADSFGFAWSQAAMHETSGKYLAKYRERLDEVPPEFRTQFEKTLAQAGQPLKLVVDESITGRIVDINGQGVAGARLMALEAWSGMEDDLAPWLEATKAERADYYSARAKTPRAMNGPQVRSLITPAVTDANGQFTLRGIGRQRIAQLLVTGPRIQSEKIFVRTQKGEPIELLQEWRSPDLGKDTYYPTDFTYVAGPSRPIVGIVRDRETKAPLAGVLVKSQHRHGHEISGWGQDFVQAVTGLDGRYRLEGMPIGDENRIAAIAASDQPYLPMGKSAGTSAGDKEVEVNFDLPPAVWVEGQVTDKQTGEGLPGWVEYHIYPDNPALEKIGQPGMVDLRDRYQANDKGRFRIPVLPGRGVISFLAFDHQKYPRGAGVTGIKGANRANGREMIRTEQMFLMPSNYHIVAEIDPPADAKSVELKLELDSGGSVKGRLVDPDGKPVSEYYYSGRLDKFAIWDNSAGDAFEIVGYDSKQPRPLYFVNTDRTLAGSFVLKENPPKDLVVTLQLAGKVTGRIVGDDGEPLGNLMLVAWHPRVVASSPNVLRIEPSTTAPLPPNRQHQSQWVTDKEGRFAIDGLAPGIEYRIKVIDRENMSRQFPPARMPRVDGGLERAIIVEPGQSLDLGDVRVVDDAKFEAAAEAALKGDAANETVLPSEAKKEKVEPATTTIQGRISGPNGESVADAHVAVIGIKRDFVRGGDSDTYRSETFGEAISDADGRYVINVPSLSSKTHQQVAAIASATGMGVVWKQISPDGKASQVPFQLKPEEVIEGRLIDIEGQPVAGAELSIVSVVVTTTNEDLYIPRDGVGFHRFDRLPAAWVQPVTSDEEGRFAIRGVAAGHGVYLKVKGTDRIAPQDIALNTGMPEQRGKRDGTYRSLVKNEKLNEETVLPLSPAQIFEGVVRYEDTREPAPHARLTIWASQQEKFGSMSSVAGNADAQGRYRISPNPGVRFGVTAYPPDGAPYLTRRMPEVRWEGGETRKQVDALLPRGILVRGKVVESTTDSPVARASIQYVPESANNPNAKDDILTGWQGIQLSNNQGEFEIVVLPGPGRLLVHGPQGEFVLQEVPGRELLEGGTGGWRNYANAVERLEPAVGEAPINVTIRLERAAKLIGRIVDEKGQPVNKALVISRLNIHPTNLTWRGGSESVPSTENGQFELGGLAPEKEVKVYFLDPARQLGATATLKANGSSPTVVLKPCGQAALKYVDGEGQPLAGHRPSIEMVVTPGPHRFESAASRRGHLAADADFVSNIDLANYRPGPVADAEGRVTLPALIPGATYTVLGPGENGVAVAKEFTVESGQTLDLGEVVINGEGNKQAELEKVEKPARKSQPAGALVTGQVVNPNGKPIAGAQVYWLKWRLREATTSPPQLMTTTDQQGLFSFTAPTPPPVQGGTTVQLENQLIVIKAEGYGLTSVRPHRLQQGSKPTSWLGQIVNGLANAGTSHQAITLSTADVPLRGKLVDIDGQPVIGAKVSIREMSDPLENLRAQPEPDTKQSPWQPRLMDILSHFAPPQLPQVAPSTTTDKNGSFALTGIGRDQLVELLIQDERIESTLILARTEVGKDLTLSPDRNFQREPSIVHPAEFTHVVGPSKPLVGRVLDLDTGEPIVGAVVQAFKIHGDPLHSSRERQYLATVSDAEGTYRITGLPIGDDNGLVAFTAGEEPYFPGGHAVDTTVAGEVVEQDFRLKRGVWAKGRVYDEKTKEPLTGQITYYVFRDAKLEQAIPSLREAFVDEQYFTNANGEFRVPVLAARGVLAFRYSGTKDVSLYPRGAGAESIEGAEPIGTYRMFPALPHSLMAENYTKVVEIYPTADQAVIQINMVLSSGKTMTVRAVSTTGVPVPNIDVFAAEFGWRQFLPSKFEVVGLKSGEDRKVFVYQPQAKLAGGTIVNTAMKDPPVVTMQPSGSLRGRLVDEEGTPISEAIIIPDWESIRSDSKVATWPYQPGRVANPTAIPVDKEGRFQIVGLPPGWKYSGHISASRKMRGRMMEMIVGKAFDGVSVNSGEEKDLGDVVVKDRQ